MPLLNGLPNSRFDFEEKTLLVRVFLVNGVFLVICNHMTVDTVLEVKGF